ncbi:MAG: hypothetical protein U1D30_05475 [Planctomycetota bacterium]
MDYSRPGGRESGIRPGFITICPTLTHGVNNRVRVLPAAYQVLPAGECEHSPDRANIPFIDNPETPRPSSDSSLISLAER